jgi:hypothetical protein
MRIFLLLLALAFGLDAYFNSGHYTKTAVDSMYTQIHSLTSGTSTNSQGVKPTRSARDPT